MTIVFVDTNLFLHYKPLNELPWRKLVGAERVTVVVARIVCTELQKNKDLGPNKQIRARANRSLRFLLTALKNSEFQLQEGVNLEIETTAPTIDFAAHNLDRKLNDDCLLASVIERKQLTQGDVPVVLLAADIGLTLVAMNHQIRTVEPPDDLRLADAADNEEKLAREVAALKARRPQMKLSFGDGESVCRFEVKPPEDVELAVESQMNDYRNRFPLELLSFERAMQSRREPDSSPLATLNRSFLRVNQHGVLGELQDEGARRYNAYLKKFYSAYEEYCKAMVEKENLRRRTVAVKLTLINLGAGAASEVNVFSEVPAHIDVSVEPDFLENPWPPEEPSKYEASEWMLGKSFRSSLAIARPAAFWRPHESAPQELPEVDSSEQSHRLRYPRIERLNQGLSVQLPVVFLTLPALYSARSFKLTYRVNFADWPDAEGELHVHVKEC